MSCLEQKTALQEQTISFLCSLLVTIYSLLFGSFAAASCDSGFDPCWSGLRLSNSEIYPKAIISVTGTLVRLAR